MQDKRTFLATIILVTATLLIQTAVPSSFALTTHQSSSASVPRNIVLFYDDFPTRGYPQYQVTKQIAKPLVAYVDQNGNPTDFMFDSFVFYSYYLYVAASPTQQYFTGWMSYLFNGSQIANLDATVADVKSTLAQPDYRLNVFLTVPVVDTTPPYSSSSVPGIITNVNSLLSSWNELNPQNLKLVGFYWGYTEDLQNNVSALIQPVANYVHSQDLKLLMIPYRTSGSLDKIHGLGVDYVTVQPNYMNDPSGNLGDFATANTAISAGYVDGVEIEIPFGNDPIKCCGGDWGLNLQTYFLQAYQYQWYRNTVTTFYHGTTISQMGANADPSYRRAYDTIYGYIQTARSNTQTTTTSSTNSVQSTTTNSSTSSAGFEVSASPNALNMPQATSGMFSVIIQSLGAFSDYVTLTATSVPNGVLVSFSPNPVATQAGGQVTSTATISVFGSVTTGAYHFEISATSGSLSKQVDITVNVSGCLIATATYGSELSPEVQFLRDFRDRQILHTFAGSNFMNVFNAWYYSFSPTVAEYIATHPAARDVMKVALYPLLGILHLSSMTYSALAWQPEVAALISGMVAASLVGFVYLALPITGILRLARRKFNIGSKRNRILYFASALIALQATFVIAEWFSIAAIMEFASAAIVLCITLGTSVSAALFVIETTKRMKA